MKKLKFYANEAICVVLHLSTQVEDFEVNNNDKIFEKLEEYNISESNILDFNIDLDNLLVSLFLLKDNSKELMFYEKSVKNECPDLPVGSYVILDSDMAGGLNMLDLQQAFNVGDEIEVAGVSYDLTNQVILYRLNTFVVTQDSINIMFDNKTMSEETEDDISTI